MHTPHRYLEVNYLWLSVHVSLRKFCVFTSSIRVKIRYDFMKPTSTSSVSVCRWTGMSIVHTLLYCECQCSGELCIHYRGCLSGRCVSSLRDDPRQHSTCCLCICISEAARCVDYRTRSDEWALHWGTSASMRGNESRRSDSDVADSTIDE